MMFDHDLLQEIKSRADIVDVISSYINVIKKGRRFVAVCPFHDDHDPSLDINRERQTYHCFVCQHGGDVFSFVADYEKISFVEAVKKVCEIINFDDPRLHKQESIKPVNVDIQTLYNCITELQKYYEYGLQTEEGSVAKDYLNKRQLSAEQIQKFSLGYSLADGKLTVSYLQKKGFSLKNIEDIGIALTKTSGTADSNAGRLIFPIKNANGQVVAFSARKLTSGDDAPKYVNSPETKIFKKGNILYNYHIAKQSAKHDGFIYLVEGFMDVLALDSIGVTSVVALMGTKMTEQHIELLKRLNVEVRLCLDTDKAGQEAMMMIMPMLDKANISYRLVSKPGEKKDPDEILKQEGEEQLKTYISTLVDPFNFALDYYKNTSPLGSIENRKKVITHFGPMLLSIKSKLEQDDYIYKLSEVTGFNANAIRDYLSEIKSKKTIDTTLYDFNFVENRNTQAKVLKELRRLTLAEKTVLDLMSEYPEAITFYEKNITHFINDIYRQIANYFVDYASTHGKIDVSMIMDIVSQSEIENKGQLINELSIMPSQELNPESLNSTLNECLEVIKQEREKTYERDMIKKAMNGKAPSEQARLLDDYMKRTNNKKPK